VGFGVSKQVYTEFFVLLNDDDAFISVHCIYLCFNGLLQEDDQLEKTQKPAKIRKKKKVNKQIADQQIKQDNGMKKKGKKNKKFKFWYGLVNCSSR